MVSQINAMNRCRRKFTALIAAVCLASGATYAIACGFEDPNSVMSRRAILNLVFPKSLYVKSAIWQAQLDGVLPRVDTAAANKSLVAGRAKYDAVAARLGSFRNGLTAAHGDRPWVSFSLVLLGPVLWTRFAPDGPDLTMTPHVSGPANGDVVLVSDETVIGALIDGRVTPQAARDLGLIRFYGEPERVHDMMTWLDQFSAPIKKMPLEAEQQGSSR